MERDEQNKHPMIVSGTLRCNYEIIGHYGIRDNLKY